MLSERPTMPGGFLGERVVMDPGYRLERALIELCESGQGERLLNNTASSLEAAIGETACDELAKLLLELIKERTGSKP